MTHDSGGWSRIPSQVFWQSFCWGDYQLSSSLVWFPISDPCLPLNRGQAQSFFRAAANRTSSDGELHCTELDGGSVEEHSALTGHSWESPWTLEEFGSDTREPCSLQWWCSNWVRHNLSNISVFSNLLPTSQNEQQQMYKKVFWNNLISYRENSLRWDQIWQLSM